MSGPFILHNVKKAGDQAPALKATKEAVDPDSSAQEHDIEPVKPTPAHDDQQTSHQSGASANNGLYKISNKSHSNPALTGYLILLPLSAVLLALGAERISAHTPFLPQPLLYIGTAICVIAFIAIFWRTLSLYKFYNANQNLMKELFDGSPSARLVTDVNGHIIYENMQFQNLKAAVLGDTASDKDDGIAILRELFDSDQNGDVELFEQTVEDAMKGNRGTFVANFVLKQTVNQSEKTPKDASIARRIFQIDAQPILGRAGYVQWRIEDVTRRHEMDELVRKERSKLLDFMNNAPVGFYSVREDGRFDFVNQTLARWLGEEVQTIIDERNIHGFLQTPPEKGKPYDIMDDGGARQIAEVMMQGVDGKSFLASISQSVVHEEEDRVRTRGVIHDLTSEREMHRALQASEDRFQTFFEEAPLGMALIDQHGMINVCNPSFAKMLGLNATALHNKEFETLIDVMHSSLYKTTMADMKQGKKLSAPIEMQLSSKKKQVFVQMFARKLQQSNTVLYFNDLTEQKTLEAQFAQSQKMQAIGQLAGGVAHDFNNLLTAMTGFCDLLLLRHKAGDPSFNDLMQIKQNSNRAANLVRQLLAFSRQQTLQARVLDITETLTELSHLFHRLLGVGIELDVIHEDGLGEVKADEGQLEQVLVNLAVNARDAMDGKGRLEIKTYPFENKTAIKRGADVMPVGKWVVIDMKDTGCGISQENIERIFEPFFTTKEIGSGTGLGLSTVYGIVRQTGGFVNVESVIGKGTSFQIYLPENDEIDDQVEVVEEKEVKVEKDLTGSATVLLVEDEDAVRGFAVRALKNKGYNVLEAASAEDAIDILENDQPDLDLMVTDVIMPEKDGPTLAREVLQTRPELPVIFVSGYTEDRFKDEFSDYNVSFLPKPFTLKQLAERVKEMLSTD